MITRKLQIMFLLYDDGDGDRWPYIKGPKFARDKDAILLEESFDHILQRWQVSVEAKTSILLRVPNYISKVCDQSWYLLRFRLQAWCSIVTVLRPSAAFRTICLAKLRQANDSVSAIASPSTS